MLVKGMSLFARKWQHHAEANFEPGLARMTSRIEDYALIGDCETAALVGNDGSIDCLCWPRFDSGACFPALLGTTEPGPWKAASALPIERTRRRYRKGTLILETEFETAQGAVTITD